MTIVTKNLKPKFEIGTKIYFKNNKQRKYKIADHVYYKSIDTWYYWLRGIQKKSINGIPEWIYTVDAKQLTIESIDNKCKEIVIINE